LWELVAVSQGVDESLVSNEYSKGIIHSKHLTRYKAVGSASISMYFSIILPLEYKIAVRRICTSFVLVCSAGIRNGKIVKIWRWHRCCQQGRPAEGGSSDSYTPWECAAIL